MPGGQSDNPIRPTPVEADAMEAPAGDSPQQRDEKAIQRLDWIFAGLLCLVTLALWAPRLGGPIDLRTDAAVYYVTGVSLAEGQGYRLLNEPGDIRAVQYPPALPAFVAMHRWVTGSADPQVLGAALRKSYFLISIAYIVCVYVMARRLVAPGYALLVGLITSLFLQTYFLSNSLFAEIPFALVTMLFLILNRKQHGPLQFAASAALAIAAYLLRSAGIALLAAWVGEAVLRRQWRQVLLRAVVAALPVLAWQGYVAWVTSQPQYTSPAYEYQRADYQYYNVPYGRNVSLADPFRPEEGELSGALLVQRLARHLLSMPLTIGHNVSTVEGYYQWTLRDAHNWFGLPMLPPRVASVVPVMLGLTALAGLVLLALRREWLLCLYAAATIVLVAATPWPAQFTRYLTPLTPILALGLVFFLLSARQRLPRRSGVALAGLVVALVIGMQLYSLLRAYRSGWVLVPAEASRVGGARMYFFDEKWHSYLEAIAWLRGRVAEGEVVAAATPQWAYIAGEYKSVMPPMEDDPAEAQRLMDTVPVRWAVVDSADVGEIVSRYLAPAIEAHPEKWTLVYETPDGLARVYRRVP